MHLLTERIVQDRNIPGDSPIEKIHYVCQHVLKYTPDPITGEMLVFPGVMARKLWDYLYESSGVQPMGDCVPLWQKVIVRDLETGSVVVTEIGRLKTWYKKFEALSYDFCNHEFVWSPISAWIDKGSLPVNRFQLTDGREIVCTDSHLLFELAGRDVKTTSALDLAKIVETQTQMPQLVSMLKMPVESSGSIGDDMAWLIGIYIAEGYHEKGRCTRVDVAQSKPEVRRQIEGCLDRLGAKYKFCDRGRKSGGQYYRVTGNVARDLLEYDLGANSFEKNIAWPILANLSESEANAMLDGIMAGDAWIVPETDWRYKYQRCIYATSSTAVKDAIVFLGLLTGRMMTSYLQIHHGGVGTQPIWRITERRRSESSQAHYRPFGNGLVNSYVKAVSTGDPEAVCDITVEGTHNFVTADGTILHNCDDKTCMEMAMLFNRRITCRAVGACQTEAFPPGAPRQINHVYPEAKYDQNVTGFILPNMPNDGRVWFPLEPSSPTLKAGQQRSTIVPMARYYARLDGQDIK